MASRLWEIRNAPRGDVDTPSPKSGFSRYVYLLKNHFWKVVGLSLILVAFSIPVITIPAALCGVNRVCVKLIREGNVFLWQEFQDEFRSSFGKSLVQGVLFASLLFAGYYFMSLGLTNADLPLWSLLFWTLGVSMALTGLCWGSYSFALTSMLELRNRDLLKNAMLLVMIGPARALGVAGVIAGTVFLTAVLYPISMVLLVLCLCGFTQYTVCFLVNGMAEKYIVGPYEAAQERSTPE